MFRSSMATDSPVGTPPKCQLPPDVTMATTPPMQQRRPHESEQKTDGRPSPKQVTMEELDVLQGCLRRWREEVETDVKGESVGNVVIFTSYVICAFQCVPLIFIIIILS